jgi:hypothetical protein
MQPSIEVILGKRNKEGTWNAQAKHPGRTHSIWKRQESQLDGIPCGHCG